MSIFLRSKDEASTALKSLIADVSPIGKIKEIHSDNGAEYMSKSFQKILIDNGIKQTSTAPYSPFQNGKSERNWRSLMEMARCLRSDANISKAFWPYAVRYAQYLRNRSYQRRTKSTAYELFTGKKPDMKNLHPFGVQCVMYKEGAKGKLDARGTDGIFLGINPINKGYYVLNQSKNSIATSRNVCFRQQEIDETRYPCKLPEKSQEHAESQQHRDANVDERDQHQSNQHNNNELQSANERRPQREVRVPRYLADYYMTASTSIDYAYSVIPEIPLSYEEAIASRDAEKWKAAMDIEIDTLSTNETWELTPLPQDRKETKGRWVFTIKQGKEPGRVQYKARYVAKGYSQVHGVDYDETFSPTTRFTSIRVLLQKAVNNGLYLHQMDVKGAYLNAPIDKDIFLQQPPGYEQISDDGTQLTCHLHKSLYGLKQSGRNWHKTLTDFLKLQEFTANENDSCIYKHITPDHGEVIILFWVDDIIIASNNLNLIAKTKELLHNKFKMDDRGELQWFLGLDFSKTKDGYYKMSQARYAEELLKRFNMSECKTANTPAEKGLEFAEISDKDRVNFPYRQAIGNLVYLATATRPDISWIISKLSQYLENPGAEHIAALKRVFRYIKGTKSFCLSYKPTSGYLQGYCDSDWAGDVKDRRSTSGYVFTLGGTPIAWKTRKQQTVALSSCEAEYMSIAEATKEMIYLRSFCTSMGLPQPMQSTIYCDNQGALTLTRETSKQHHRTKHIDVRFHFIRQQTEIGYEYITSQNNLADIFTKPLSKVSHNKAIHQLQIEGVC